VGAQNKTFSRDDGCLGIIEMVSTPSPVSSRDHSRPSTPGITRRLPFLGSPGSSWQVYRDNLVNTILSREFRTAIAFFIFGLINNILYVIVLSVILLLLLRLTRQAALDLVGPTVPKAVVLLPDIIPSFLFKAVAPYFFHIVPYKYLI
jgi:battenin